jgi:hypothetical protein
MAMVGLSANLLERHAAYNAIRVNKHSSINPKPSDLETDPRFPSGKWIGFWLQRCYAGRQWMNLELTFINGVVRGGGTDRVGEFTMAGEYDLVTGACTILKAYAGAHGVSYEGRNEGDGMWIWGLWSIRASDRGGFHLWPAGEEDPTGRKLRAEESAPREKRRVKLKPIEEPTEATSWHGRPARVMYSKGLRQIWIV